MNKFHDEITAIVATFPAEFGIWTRGAEGLKFRIDRLGSFYDRSVGIQIATQVWSDAQDQWLDYSRHSVERLRGLVRPLKG